MSNRRANKKRRDAVRRRMARTGESYQRALQSLLRQATQPEPAAEGGADLVAFSYYGTPSVLFTVCHGELRAFALLRGAGHSQGPHALGLQLRFFGAPSRSN